MSLKRQLQYKYHNFIQGLKSLALPEWMTGASARLVLSTVVVLLGSAYVFQTSAAATRGYEMASLEKQMAGLETEIQKIEVDVAKNSSLIAISSRLPETKMVELGQVKYFTPLNNEMAKR